MQHTRQKRRQIAYRPMFVTYLILLAVLFTTYTFFIKHIPEPSFFAADKTTTFIVTISVLFMVSIAFRIAAFKKLYYDRNYLFIESFRHKEKISLDKVYVLKESGFSVGSQYVWSVLYVNEKGQEAKAYFLPAFFFERFKKEVMLRNPSIKISTERIL